MDASLDNNNPTNSYKKVKNYLISLDNKHLLGQGRHGEVREGYRQNRNRLLIFKIVNLPLTLKTQSYIRKHMRIGGPYIQNMYEPAYSSSKCYIPLQYLVKMVSKSKPEYQFNLAEIGHLARQLVNSYSYLYCLGVAHGNIKYSNVGYDHEDRLKFTDITFSNDFEATAAKDLVDAGTLLYNLYFGETHQNSPPKNCDKLINIFMEMIEQKTSWPALFSQFFISNRYTEIILQNNPYHCQNRILVLDLVVKSLKKTEAHCYLKISIYRLMYRLLDLQLADKSIKSREYRKILLAQRNSLRMICSSFKSKYHLGVKDLLLNNDSAFQLGKHIALVVLSALHPNLNHQYIYNQLRDELTDGEITTILDSLLARTDLEKYIL